MDTARLDHRPWLIVTVGPVGVGKTTFAVDLCKRVTATLVSNDDIRRELFESPRYDAAESNRVYCVAFERILTALTRGNVVYDGTNLGRSHRAALLDAVGSRGITLFVVVFASEELLRARLAARDTSLPRSDGRAWWSVYEELVSAFEAPSEPHLLVDSTAATKGVFELLTVLMGARQSSITYPSGSET